MLSSVHTHTWPQLIHMSTEQYSKLCQLWKCAYWMGIDPFQRYILSAHELAVHKSVVFILGDEKG